MNLKDFNRISMIFIESTRFTLNLYILQEMHKIHMESIGFEWNRSEVHGINTM